jgi:hypothetical protein
MAMSYNPSESERQRAEQWIARLDAVLDQVLRDNRFPHYSNCRDRVEAAVSEWKKRLAKDICKANRSKFTPEVKQGIEQAGGGDQFVDRLAESALDVFIDDWSVWMK